MKKKPPFQREQFTATSSATAEAKAHWANAMVSWIERGFPEKGWRKGLYKPLSTHLYGHIAHYHLYGFYDEWFNGIHCQLAWLEYVAHGGIYGDMRFDPANTWNDVEQELSAWVRVNGLLDRYRRLCAADSEKSEQLPLAALTLA